MNAQIKNKVVEEVLRFSTDLNSARYKSQKGELPRRKSGFGLSVLHEGSNGHVGN